MMHMTFYWGKTVTILFDSWRTTTWLGYLLSLLAVFLVAAFYQYLEDRRIKLKLLKVTKKPPIEAPLLSGAAAAAASGLTASKIAVAVIFGINSAIGYMLMLSVMSFNWGVFIAVCLGLMIGYLAFRSGADEDVLTIENPCACA